jgi:sigma-E factor negative regulatory protein RseA
MEKISQLMDGELEEHECRVQFRRLGEDVGLVQRWQTYHVIRDVLRDEAAAGPDLVQRVRLRLDKEPTVIAPHTRLVARVARYTLPMAAAIAGVVVVGWLAVSLRPAIESAGSITAETARPPVSAATKPPASFTVASANGQMDEYLLAHQEYSPSTAIQGVASYIRTVSTRDSEIPR